ncbi:ribonuclease H-like domain-containing protein [Tanacetum coccineum]
MLAIMMSTTKVSCLQGCNKSLWEAIKNGFDMGEVNQGIKTIEEDQFSSRIVKTLLPSLLSGGCNIKLLRSLPSAWNNIALIMRNKSDLDALSMDDLYNNLKVYESECIRAKQVQLKLRRMWLCFLSLTPSKTLMKNCYTAYSVSAASTKDQASTLSYADNIDADDSLKDMDLKLRLLALTRQKLNATTAIGEVILLENAGHQGIVGIVNKRCSKKEWHQLTLSTTNALGSSSSDSECFGIVSVTILNTLDPLGKFDGKADEGFLVGYSINSKAFRVFNTRARKVEENPHITFLENKPNVAGSGPDWLFNIDLLTNSMNYEPVIAGNQTNGNAGIKDNVDVVPTQQYILLPLLSDSPQSSKDAVANDAGKRTTKEPADEGERNGQEKEGGASNKEGDQNVQDLRAELDKLLVQQKEGYVNNTNRVSTISPSVSAVGQSFVNADDLPIDPLMPNLEDTTDLLNTSIFSGAYDDEDVGAEADLNNLEITMNVSPIPTTRIHKDHPLTQIIGDIMSPPQTRRMTRNVTEHGMFGSAQHRINHKDFQNCLFACFLSQEEPKKVIQALTDPSWIEAMQDELLQFKLQKLETGMTSGTRLTKEEGIDYVEVFATVVGLMHLGYFLPMYHVGLLFTVDMKSAFLYGTIEEEVYVCQPPGFEDPKFPDKVYKVYVDDIIFGSTKKSLCVEFEQMMHKRFQMSSIGELTFFLGLQVSHLHAVKRIFRYLKGQPKLGLLYSRDSPFDLEAFSDSDYAGASLDRKSTTGGMLRNLDPTSKKFLMYPRFLELFLNNHIALAEPFNDVYVTHVHTKKVFTNMKRQNKDFLRTVTLLFASMLVPQVVEGEGFRKPSEPQPPSSTAPPSLEEQVTTVASQPQKTHTSRRVKRGRDTEIPQSSGPPKKVGDEAVYKGEDDRVVRAATTATSLEAKKESGNIHKTRSMATLNEPSPQGTGLGSRLSGEDSMEHQDDLKDFVAPTPHDSPLSGGHTPGSDKGRSNITELMAICTKLSNRVLALEHSKTAQDLVIKKLQKIRKDTKGKNSMDETLQDWYLQEKEFG